MSENQEVSNRKIHKRKKQDPQLEDSGDSSDGSLGHCKKRIKLLKDGGEVENNRVRGGEEEDKEKEIYEKTPNIIYKETESSNLQTMEEIEVTLSTESAATFSTDVHENELNNIDAASSSTETCSENDMTDSIAGKSEKCPICLNRFTTQEIGTPETCKHNFCLSCLQAWAKHSNVCPVDRQMFATIIVRRCLEGEETSRISVEPPRPQDIEFDEDLNTCDVCGGSDREESMLNCMDCGYCFHLECLDPSTSTLPLEERPCSNCNQTSLYNPHEESESRCVTCGQCDRQESILICFECDHHYHLECLDPSTDALPFEERTCPNCNKTRLFSLHDEPRCGTCKQCERQESMVSCVECDRSYHPECLDPTKVGFCPNCNKTSLFIPDEPKCAICKNSDREDSMLMCFECDHRYHLECLDSPTDTAPHEDRSCPNCNNTSLFSLNDEARCSTCKQCDREDNMLSCEECERYYHPECLDPTTNSVLVEERPCPNCNQTTLFNPNDDPCSVCWKRSRVNSMLSCGECECFYHLECLDPPTDTIPVEERSCPQCKQPTLLKPHEKQCGVCRERTRQNIMLLCIECNHNYHKDCLEPSIEDIPIETRPCPNCEQPGLFNPNEHSCELCWRFSDKDDMLFCSKCILHFHQECLEPPAADAAPLEGRLCPKCNQTSLFKPKLPE